MPSQSANPVAGRVHVVRFSNAATASFSDMSRLPQFSGVRSAITC